MASLEELQSSTITPSIIEDFLNRVAATGHLYYDIPELEGNPHKVERVVLSDNKLKYVELKDGTSIGKWVSISGLLIL